MKSGTDDIFSVIHETAKGLRDARIMEEKHKIKTRRI